MCKFKSIIGYKINNLQISVFVDLLTFNNLYISKEEPCRSVEIYRLFIYLLEIPSLSWIQSMLDGVAYYMLKRNWKGTSMLILSCSCPPHYNVAMKHGNTSILLSVQRRYIFKFGCSWTIFWIMVYDFVNKASAYNLI